MNTWKSQGGEGGAKDLENQAEAEVLGEYCKFYALAHVRKCTMASGMGPAGLSRCAATPGHAAACGATAKHKVWDAPCQEMGYDFVAFSIVRLPIETGIRPKSSLNNGECNSRTRSL